MFHVPQHKIDSRGFTIVELLVVVVVIAVLAAIVIVSYNGITRQAEITTIKSDLTGTAKKMESDKIMNGGRFSAATLTPYLLNSEGNANLRFRYGTTTDFCIDAISKKDTNLHYYIESSLGVAHTQIGTCPDTSSIVTTRCVAGRVVLVVSQENYSDAPVTAHVTTPHGNSTGEHSPGQTESYSFSTYSSTMNSGIATIQLDSTSGTAFSVTRFHAYEARSC